MNVKLLKKVAAHIAAEPRRINMNWFCESKLSPHDHQNPPCGTRGCIAGWAVILTDGTEKANDAGVRHRAQELLELTSEEGSRLFAEPRFAVRGDTDTSWGANIWPKEFALRYEKAKTSRGRASATVSRINHFIATKGAE